MDNPSQVIDNISIPKETIIPPWITLILIVVFFGLLLFYVLPFLSKHISLLGLYHKLSNEDIASKKEKVRASYFCISIPLIGSYLVVLLTLNIQITILTSLLAVSSTMITLLIIRIYGNPTKDKTPITQYFPFEKREMIIEQHRERFLSFLFSLIAAQMIVALLGFGYMAILNKGFTVDIDPVAILIFIVAFIVGLFSITEYSEYHLKKYEPENKIDYFP
ncbi:MAG: hypothetical protein OS112_01005 [Methanoregula sp.]|nr:MAG: hypothetical protein OS112_01005 [Methanoregula sp.]